MLLENLREAKAGKAHGPELKEAEASIPAVGNMHRSKIEAGTSTGWRKRKSRLIKGTAPRNGIDFGKVAEDRCQIHGARPVAGGRLSTSESTSDVPYETLVRVPPGARS